MLVVGTTPSQPEETTMENTETLAELKATWDAITPAGGTVDWYNKFFAGEMCTVETDTALWYECALDRYADFHNDAWQPPLADSQEEYARWCGLLCQSCDNPAFRDSRTCTRHLAMELLPPSRG